MSREELKEPSLRPFPGEKGHPTRVYFSQGPHFFFHVQDFAQLWF